MRVCHQVHLFSDAPMSQSFLSAVGSTLEDRPLNTKLHTEEDNVGPFKRPRLALWLQFA